MPPNPPTPTPTPHLLALPPELRLAIYTYILIPPHPQQLNPWTAYTPPPHTSLLLTCRRISTEALSLYRLKTTFRYSLTLPCFLPNSSLLHRFFVPLKVLRNIKRLTLELDDRREEGKECDEGTVKQAMLVLGHFVKYVVLYRLEIVVVARREFTGWGSWVMEQEVLDALRDMKVEREVLLRYRTRWGENVGRLREVGRRMAGEREWVVTEEPRPEAASSSSRRVPLVQWVMRPRG